MIQKQITILLSNHSQGVEPIITIVPYDACHVGLTS